MKALAIILIVDTVLNAILKIIIYKLQKDIEGVEMLRESIHNEMRESMRNEDNK